LDPQPIQVQQPDKGFKTNNPLRRPPGVHLNARCLPAAAARMPGPRLGLPQPGCDTARHPGPRRSDGVRWPGSHACTRPRARCTKSPPGSRGCARRCQRGKSQRPALVPAAACSGRSPTTLSNHFAWRRGAWGEDSLAALARRGGQLCSPAGRRPILERVVACAGHSYA
jgi:hypothetical protein